MKTTIITIIFTLSLLVSSHAHAFYQTFHHQGYSLEVSVPDVVLGFEESTQTLVVQPEFKGTADRFVFVTVVPNEPTTAEVDPSTITDLQVLTEPLRIEITNATVTTSDGEVTIIPVATEPQYHTDYETRFFPTSDIDGLTTWLDEQEYQYQPEHLQALSRYVEATSTFVVIEVNVAETAEYDDEGYFGTLSPIALRFNMVTPYLSLPVMNTSQEMDNITYNIYTLSPKYFYIPAVDTLFSKQIDTENTQLISAENPWLVRQQVTINPSMSTQDLYLNTDATGVTINAGKYSSRTINPEFLQKETGIIEGSTPSIDEVTQSYDNLLNGTRLLTYGVQGEDVKELQAFLNFILSLELVTDGKWGPLTDEAVKSFQTQHNLKVDGIVGNQTRTYITQVLGE